MICVRPVVHLLAHDKFHSWYWKIAHGHGPARCTRSSLGSGHESAHRPAHGICISHGTFHGTPHGSVHGAMGRLRVLVQEPGRLMTHTISHGTTHGTFTFRGTGHATAHRMLNIPWDGPSNGTCHLKTQDCFDISLVVARHVSWDVSWYILSDPMVSHPMGSQGVSCRVPNKLSHTLPVAHPIAPLMGYPKA